MSIAPSSLSISSCRVVRAAWRSTVLAAVLATVPPSALVAQQTIAQTIAQQTVAQQGRPIGALLPYPVPPSMGPAPRVVQDTGTVKFAVNGVNVILKRNPANDVVAANVYLLGGTRLATWETAGIEPFLLAASERGTQRFPGTSLRRLTASLGSTIGIDATHDWTEFGLLSIRSTFDSTWAILTDRILRPTLDSSETELVRAQIVSALRQRRAAPDAWLEVMADSVAFAGHPYAIPPSGTAESIANLPLRALRDWQREQMVTSRMLVVVVGNLERAHVERLVAGTLGALPRGDYVWAPPAALPPARRTIAVDARPLPTNYLLGYYAGPPATSKDYAALRIASAILSGRLFAELRGNRNLTYATEAPFLERAIGASGFYVTTTQPEVALRVLRDEIAMLSRNEVQQGALARLVQRFVTDYFLKNETAGDQATFLARAELYDGDYRAAGRFVENLRQVRPADVQRVARQYLRDLRLAYIGNPRQAPSLVLLER